jgi:hypothetical protein
VVWRPHLLVSLLAVVAAFVIATRADAATFTTTCVDALDAISCAAITERQETIVGLLESHSTKLDAIEAAASVPPAEAPATLSLDALDSQKLDLIWSGVWFTGGVAFGVWAFRRLGREAVRWGGGS